MIVSGGVNIYPQEIEDVLVLHPAVADVAVFGIPDPEMGEEVKAVVQPAPGIVPGPDLEGEIIEFCRANLSHYKCPRTVDFTDLSPGRERQAVQEGPPRGLLGQLGPQHHLNLGGRPHVGVPGQAQRDHGAEQQHAVMPTASTTGPMSRFPMPTVPPKPIIHSAMTRPRTFSCTRACRVVFNAVMKAK